MMLFLIHAKFRVPILPVPVSVGAPTLSASRPGGGKFIINRRPTDGV